MSIPSSFRRGFDSLMTPVRDFMLRRDVVSVARTYQELRHLRGPEVGPIPSRGGHLSTEDLQKSLAFAEAQAEAARRAPDAQVRRINRSIWLQLAAAYQSGLLEKIEAVARERAL